MSRESGGKQAAVRNKLLYGDDYYKIIGAKGGKKGAKDGVIKGFAAMPRKKRQEAGRKGARSRVNHYGR